MSILAKLKSPGHITEAVIHVNEARNAIESSRSFVEISRGLFDALNKIQTEWLLDHPRQPGEKIGEVKTFQLMTHGLPPEARTSFLRSSQLGSLVDFEPRVMNHDTLRNGGYRPASEIPVALAKAASKEHQKLVTAYRQLESSRDSETEDRVLKRAAEMLYVVRSNIAHGEKPPYDPNHEKRKRDESVCAIIIPLQLMLIDLLLDRPSTKLVAYGTLAPGKSNHRFIENISGAWRNCTLRGSMDVIDGLPILSWDPAGPNIDAQVLLSEQLPEHWPRIDDFEGSAYKRRLITISTSGAIDVAFIYVGTSQ
ncbi:MAG: gamma-glutamylcyclotransferase [Nitrospira sp.]